MAFFSSDIYLFLYTMVFIAHLTALPQLIIHKVCLNSHNILTCDNLQNHTNSALRDVIFGDAAIWNLGILLSQLVPSLFTVLFWGPMADRIGRSRAMIIPPIVGSVQSCIYFLCSISDSHVSYLFFGSWISSMYGEFQGVLSFAYGYMASSTNHKERTMRMTILESCLYFASFPAVIAVGFCIQYLGFSQVFIATFCIHVMNMLYVIFFLPSQSGLMDRKNNYDNEDTISDDELRDIGESPSRRSLTLPSINPRDIIQHTYDLIWLRNKDRAILLPLLICFGLLLMVVVGELDIMVLYVKNDPFLLSPTQTSYYIATVNTIRALGMLILSQIGVRVFNLSDYSLAIIGVISQMLTLLFTAISVNTTMLFLVAIIGFGYGQPYPVVRSLISKFFHGDNQCTVISIFEFIDVVASILAALSVSSIYQQTVGLYSGSVYIILSMLSLMALLIFIYLIKIEGRKLGNLENDETETLLQNELSDTEDQ